MVLDEFLYKIGFNIDKGKLDGLTNALNNLKTIAGQIAAPIQERLNASFAKNQELINGFDDVMQKANQEAAEFKAKVTQAKEALADASDEAIKTPKNIEKSTKAAQTQTKGLKAELESLRNKFFLIKVASTALSGIITNYLSRPLKSINEPALKLQVR